MKKEINILKDYRNNKTEKKIGFIERTSVIIPRGKDWDWALFSKMAAAGLFSHETLQLLDFFCQLRTGVGCAVWFLSKMKRRKEGKEKWGDFEARVGMKRSCAGEGKKGASAKAVPTTFLCSVCPAPLQADLKSLNP